MKILIVGAGIAGLAIGWRLAEAGAAVNILERGRAGRGASWASAGMLAPGAEAGAEARPPVAWLAHESRNAWPSFAKELETASGCDIGFREDGSLITADSETRARALTEQVANLQASGAAVSWLAPKELREREPLLSPNLRGALYVGGDAQVDNRALLDALCVALSRSHVPIREECVVRSLVTEKNRVRGVVTEAGMIEGDAVILATGAWLNFIGGTLPDDLPKVMPAKGQMVALEPPDGTVLAKALIWDGDVYLVPKRGRLLAGATMEDAGFDTSVTREARDRLVKATARLIPASSEWRLAEIWAGLRPRTADGAPVLGATAISGLYVAGGQFRNGILFAPLIAEVMGRIVMGEPPAPEMTAFDPRRFSLS